MNDLDLFETVVEIKLSLVERGYFQPREYFDPELMETTKRSIAQKGQMYPVLVRPIKNGNPLFNGKWDEIHYELADGERRFRCCRELNFKTIKAIIRNLSDEEMLEYSVTTNDAVPLNPIERGRVFHRLKNEFNKTQDEIAKAFNLKQQQVSEYLRLLELPNKIQDFTARAVISLRHARELCKISNSETQLLLCDYIVDKKISTRELTKKVQEIMNKNGDISNHSHEYKVAESDIIFDDKDINNNNEIQTSNSVLDDHDEILSKIEDKLFKPEEKISILKERNKFRGTKQDKILYPILDFFSQINALILFGKPRQWLKHYLSQHSSLRQITPEQYLAWFEISILAPTIVLYVTFRFYPLAALAIGCIGTAILMLKLFEDR